MLDRVAICCFITGWASKSACSRMMMKQPAFWLSAPRMGVTVRVRGTPAGQCSFRTTGTSLKLSPNLGHRVNRDAPSPAPAMRGISPQKGHGSPGPQGLPKEFLGGAVEKDHLPVAVGDHHRIGKLPQERTQELHRHGGAPVNAGGTSGRLGGASRPDFMARSFSPA